MGYIIRRKDVDDCEICEKIITLSWWQTYRGIVSEQFLLSLKDNEGERITRSINNFKINDDIIYVLELDNNVVGFVSCGRCEDVEFSGHGEIFALYIIDGYKKKGYGRKLFETAVGELKYLGFDKMIVGCLEGNPSNDFYRYMGGKKVKERIIVRGGQELIENIYFYEL